MKNFWKLFVTALKTNVPLKLLALLLAAVCVLLINVP